MADEAEGSEVQELCGLAGLLQVIVTLLSSSHYIAFTFEAAVPQWSRSTGALEPRDKRTQWAR